ncbi:hypothetical protein CK203_093009 [Vitis vinifera]|uniref:Uncharacterized protein n=1 Tax=Vitis vinifera TaxID=29760 RepID=A0A438DFL1_VITVI|nr:hypothetical protein CK203_093009 [Vitis vinifera]
MRVSGTSGSGVHSNQLEFFFDPLLKLVSQGPEEWVSGAEEALLDEASGFQSGSVCLPRDEPSCNGRLLDISGVAEKGLSGRDLVVRDDKVEDFRAMKAGGDSMGELVVSKSLPYEFTKLSNFLGMPMAGYEREITSLLRKLEARKGRGLKISMGKKKTWEGERATGFNLFYCEVFDGVGVVCICVSGFGCCGGGLRKVIGKVVSLDQNVFVMGRQILDASLIANEFLMKVMQKMGFGSKWMGWMWRCISTAKFSVLGAGYGEEGRK